MLGIIINYHHHFPMLLLSLITIISDHGLHPRLQRIQGLRAVHDVPAGTRSSSRLAMNIEMCNAANPTMWVKQCHKPPMWEWFILPIIYLFMVIWNIVVYCLTHINQQGNMG